MRSSRFFSWLDRRIPPARRVRLGQRSIFIFPTAVGGAFVGLVAVLMLAAINYENSLIYALAFLLISLLLVTILHTYRNLAGLTVEFGGADRGFAGEDIGFCIHVKRPPGAGRVGVQIGAPQLVPQALSIDDQESCSAVLFVNAPRRGWLDPGRFIVETSYPVGLVRAWTWIDLEARALVYPRPTFDPWPPRAVGGDRPRTHTEAAGSDDFEGLRDYRAGDPTRHLLWRAYARSGELVVKEYGSPQGSRQVFDWDDVPGDTEQRLSRLAGAVLTAARNEQAFGLRLPGFELAPASGESHAEDALRALALHGA
jgi:uncharacterized protein (DUF58 family)